MLVSYLGNTQGTLFGAIMFEADRLLKCLDKGVHNETHKALRATVPGFKPLLEMVHPGDGRPENVWHRFWFVIDKVELIHNSAAQAFTFGDVRLKVLTETEKDGHPQEQYADPADETFTRHLTEHYDEYAKDFPILARLKEIAKVAAVAKFLVNQGISLDLGPLFATPPVAVETPATTPGIRVTSPNVKMYQEGNTIHTESISLFGGVDLDPEPQILPDTSGFAAKLRSQAESSRPDARAVVWSFQKNGDRIKALLSSFNGPRSPQITFHDDHCFSGTKEGETFSLKRCYNPTASRSGNFGSGWSLWVPYSLTYIPPSGKRAEVLTRQERDNLKPNPVLILHDQATQQTHLYRPIKENESSEPTLFCRVTAQTLKKRETSFQYDHTDQIRKQGDCYVMNRGGCKLCFGPDGHLLEMSKEGGHFKYHWAKDNLVRMDDGSGHFYIMQYSPLEPQYVTEIEVSDGRRLNYNYNEAGLLVSCSADQETVVAYAYDDWSRLSEIRNKSGLVIRRNVYDDFSNLVNAAADIVSTPSGDRIRRTLDQGRVVAAKDQAGTEAIFVYGKQNELTDMTLKGRSGKTWHLGYDARGWIKSFRDSLNRETRFNCDEQGKMVRSLNQNGELRSFLWDDQGRLAGIAAQDAEQWTFEYDSAGKVCGLSGPGGEKWRFEYADNLLQRAAGPTQQVQITQNKATLTVQINYQDGAWSRKTYDHNRRLSQYQKKGLDKTQLYYDEQGHIASIQNGSNVIRYQVDEKRTRPKRGI